MPPTSAMYCSSNTSTRSHHAPHHITPQHELTPHKSYKVQSLPLFRTSGASDVQEHSICHNGNTSC